MLNTFILPEARGWCLLKNVRQSLHFLQRIFRKTKYKDVGFFWKRELIYLLYTKIVGIICLTVNTLNTEFVFTNPLVWNMNEDFFSLFFISSLEGKKSWNVCDHYIICVQVSEWMHALGFAFSKVSFAGSGSLPLSEFWILPCSKCFPTINLCWTIKFSVQCQEREGSAFRNQRKKEKYFPCSSIFHNLFDYSQASKHPTIYLMFVYLYTMTVSLLHLLQNTITDTFPVLM